MATEHMQDAATGVEVYSYSKQGGSSSLGKRARMALAAGLSCLSLGGTVACGNLNGPGRDTGLYQGNGPQRVIDAAAEAAVQGAINSAVPNGAYAGGTVTDAIFGVGAGIVDGVINGAIRGMTGRQPGYGQPGYGQPGYGGGYVPRQGGDLNCYRTRGSDSGVVYDGSRITGRSGTYNSENCDNYTQYEIERQREWNEYQRQQNYQSGLDTQYAQDLNYCFSKQTALEEGYARSGQRIPQNHPFWQECGTVLQQYYMDRDAAIQQRQQDYDRHQVDQYYRYRR